MEMASAMMDDATISLVVSALEPEEAARCSEHVRSGGSGVVQITAELGVAGRTAAWPITIGLIACVQHALSGYTPVGRCPPCLP
jgi:hypothetical protein